MLSAEYGLAAEIKAALLVRALPGLLDRGRLYMASVHASIRMPQNYAGIARLGHHAPAAGMPATCRFALGMGISAVPWNRRCWVTLADGRNSRAIAMIRLLVERAARRPAKRHVDPYYAAVRHKRVSRCDGVGTSIIGDGLAVFSSGHP